eukprot:4707570-Alexandrium_andersonii.AAC.1
MQSRDGPEVSCWRIAEDSTAPLTSRRMSPALSSRGSPGNWRFHAPTAPSLTALTTRPGSAGHPR